MNIFNGKIVSNHYNFIKVSKINLQTLIEDKQ
jgi:hypothetical protein